MRVISISENRIVFDNGDTIKVSSEEGNVSHALDLRLFGNSLLEYEFTSRPMFGIVPKMFIIMYHKDRVWTVPYKNQNIKIYYNSDVVRVKNMKALKTLINSFDRSELVDKTTLARFKNLQVRMNILKNSMLPSIHKDYLKALRYYKQCKWHLMNYIHEYKECRKRIKQINNEITNARYAHFLQVLNDTRSILSSEYYNDIRPEPRIQHGLIENEHKFTEWIDKIIKDVVQGTSKPSDELIALIFDTLVQLGHEQSSMQTSLPEEIEWEDEDEYWEYIDSRDEYDD